MSKEFFYQVDQYSEARGGLSDFLAVFCAECGEQVLFYQKDGPGKLKRMYADRIVAPEDLANKMKFDSALPEFDLFCPCCGQKIATAMVYKKETRPAFEVTGKVLKIISEDNLFPMENILTKAKKG